MCVYFCLVGTVHKKHSQQASSYTLCIALVFPFPLCIGFVFPLLYFRSDCLVVTTRTCKAVFFKRRAAARYRALASIILGRERPEETTICYEISFVQLIANFNIILYLSTCHTLYISALIRFMIMP
jgi:hypothetical protein